MQHADFAIKANHVGKCYHIYSRPIDRLKQSLWRGKKTFYNEFWAFQRGSFTIKKGESLGIVGSNGSGKSTLLKMICGILHPTVGEIEVNGRIAALLELGSGFNPEFTGRENIFMSAAILGLTRLKTTALFDEIVDFADIGSFIEQPVKMYSSGMKMRLAFAVALKVSPDILVLDEVLAVGDMRFQQKCMAKIKKFFQTGTVILVSHNLSAVTELCSRVIWIESGKIRMDDQPKRVTEKYMQYMHEGDISSKWIDPKQNSNPKNNANSSDIDWSTFVQNNSKLKQFGDNRATIKAFRIRSQAETNGILYGGQACEISMIVDAHENITDPIFGYIVIDQFGRNILGDNTIF
ncbi:MAG: lipopolysaccharide transport system ATP-binding protein [Candidatus Magnetoglobus multicellularis str. Araruama]|uniref:Lipopolysaccharide transport system ATP-binding protein n=1 Tax=Candidatus Magnetoglobus multicellularis str. Araruama TaxID=890399 RepID=A0A1V1P0Z1_9BACT|nr:MAG: lipopolysaccharide transport system ATP-binding protein [Candidatus Magnetoglobus multicellularis str. Araruama]